MISQFFVLDTIFYSNSPKLLISLTIFIFFKVTIRQNLDLTQLRDNDILRGNVPVSELFGLFADECYENCWRL